MNSILKNSGLALIVLAAIVLMLSYFLQWTNCNAVQSGSLIAMVVGLVVYIIFGKKSMAEDK
jgi:xanthine/uracil permease